MGIGPIHFTRWRDRPGSHGESYVQHKYPDQASRRVFFNAGSAGVPNVSSYANGDCHTHAITYADRHCDSHSFEHANRYPDADFDPNSNSDCYDHSFARALQHTDSNTHAAGTRSKTRTLCDRN